MVVDPEALAKYLNKPIKYTPDWKNINSFRLQDYIETATGEYFRRCKGPPLYDHQLRSLAMALVEKQILLFLGMRTGKTRIALEYASHLRKTRQWKGKALIIVPSPTVLDVWEEQILEYTKLRYYILRSTKENDLLEAVEGKYDIIVVAWSSLQKLLTKKQIHTKRGKVQIDSAGEAVMKLKVDVDTCAVLGTYFTMMIIDEIHLCKTKDTLRYQIAEIVSRNHSYRLGLTGTPFGRHPLDIWPQAYLIDGGKALGGHPHFFNIAFSIVKYNHFSKFRKELKFDDKKLGILSNKLRPISIAYKLEDIREINELSRITELTMAGEQAALYKKAVEQQVTAIIEEQKEGLPARGINSFVRLRQISSGHVAFIDNAGRSSLATLPSHAKLIWLRKAIASGMEDAPFVIFYEFTASGQQIVNELRRAKLKVGWVYGEGKTNSEDIRNFQNGKLHGLVINSKSGGVGIDLWPADYVYFYESSVSPIVRAQAEKRPFGPKRGNRPVILEDVIASKIEERVYGFIKEGKALLDRTIHTKRELINWFS